MTSTDTSSRLKVSTIWFFPILLCILGTLAAHSPMIFGGLSKIQVDHGDSRLINYILEHSYLWVTSQKWHEQFWSPPFYYPAPNVAAFSDVLLTSAPVYWIFRVFRAAPDTAFQLWMIAISALNYVVAFWMFRKGFRTSILAASMGAFLIAFGAPRVNQLGHQQLLPTFFPCLSVFALCRVFTNRNASILKRGLYWQIASLGVVAQLYSGFYLGWFLLFGLSIATICGLTARSSRPILLDVIRRDFLLILLSAIAGWLLLRPFLFHYGEAVKELGKRFYPGVRMSIPHPWSWFDIGPHNWIWGWTSKLALFRSLMMEIEHRIGLGVLTPIVCGAGLYLTRKRPESRILGLSWLVMISLSTYLPGEFIANIAVIVALVGTTWIFWDLDRPNLRILVLAGLVALLTFEKFPSNRVIGLGHFLLVVCLIEAFQERNHPWTLLTMAIVISWTNVRLFGTDVLMASGIAIAVLVLLGWWRTKGARIVVPLGLTAWCAFASLVSIELQLSGFLLGVLGALILLPLLANRPSPFPPKKVAKWVLIALPSIVIFEFRDTLWEFVYDWVPGGSAIRSVARIGLITLFPAAIGLTMFLDQPSVKKRSWLVAIVALVCLLEQGITTPAYDKFIARSHVAEIASKIPDDCLTFYYRPKPGEYPEWHYQIDAMWASLARQIPTINGYSGGAPRAWSALSHVDDKYGPTVPNALNEWIRRTGLPRDRVARIGEDDFPNIAEPSQKQPR